MPLGHEVLVPGPELLAVGGAGSRPLAPDVGETDGQRGIHDAADGLAQGGGVDKAPAYVEQVRIADLAVTGGHTFEPRIGAQAVEAQQQAPLQDLPRQGFTGGEGLECLGETQAQVRLFEDIEETGHRPAPPDLGLEGLEPGRLWLSIQGRDDERMLAGRAQAHLGIGRQAGIQCRQPPAEVLLEGCEEGLHVRGLAEGQVVDVPLGLEVPGKVLVGVAVAVCPLDPDLLAPQPLAQGLEDADLVVDAVDALPVRPLLDEELLQLGPDDPGNGDFGAGYDVPAVLAMGPQPVQCLDHGPVLGVVGAEGQSGQNRRQHAPIVVGVGAVDQGLDALTEGRTGCLALLDQGAEGVLSHQWEEDLTHGAVGVVQRRLGDAKQQARLVLDLVDLPDQLDGHPLLRAHPNAVHELEHEVDEPVGNLAAPLRAERRQQCPAHPVGVAAQVPGRLGPCPGAVTGQDLRGDSRPQTVGQREVPNQAELGYFLLDAGQADAARIGLQAGEHGAAGLRALIRVLRIAGRPIRQGFQPSPGLRPEGLRDLGEELLFKEMNRRPDQALRVLLGRWLKALLPAPVSNREPQVSRLQVPRRHLCLQPAAQPPLVGHLDGAEPEIAPNPRAVALTAAAPEVVVEPGLRWDRQLLAQKRQHRPRDVAVLPGETPVELEVLQQDRDADPTSVGAIGQQRCLRLEQGPVLGQFLLVPASFHGRTASGAWKADILTSPRQAARILAFPHMAVGCSFAYFAPCNGLCCFWSAVLDCMSIAV
jgi:hypothetical protein